MRVDLVFMGNGIAERGIEARRLKAEGLEVEAFAAVRGAKGLKRLHELSSQAGALVLGLDPDLLEFAARSPPAANGTAKNLTVLVLCET